MKHFLKRNLAIISSFLVMLLLAAAVFSPAVVKAITPKVILSEYKIKASDPSGNIYPGDTFTVTVKLKNTAKSKVLNLKCTISSENGEMIPVDSTGSVYINEMNGEEEKEISLKMSTLRTLEEKSYKLIVRSQYEDWNGKYEEKETIYVPVKQKTEVVLSDAYIAEEEIRLGDNIEVAATINNVGGTTIYKVSAKTAGDNIAEASIFVGNIAPGKKGNIDIITKATNVSNSSTYKNRIIVTYEDADGHEYTEEIRLGDEAGRINVLEQDFSDIIQIKEDTSKHMTASTKLLIAAAIMFIIAIVWIVLRQRKRRRLEREFD